MIRPSSEAVAVALGLAARGFILRAGQQVPRRLSDIGSALAAIMDGTPTKSMWLRTSDDPMPDPFVMR